MYDWDAEERKTNIRPQITSDMSAEAFAKAILSETGYKEALDLQEANGDGYVEYTNLVQQAMCEYALTMRFSKHEADFKPMSTEQMEHLLAITKQAMTYTDTLHTDTPCLIWASPYDERCSDPITFTSYIAAMSLETDAERTYEFDKMDVQGTTDFLNFVRKHEPNETLESIIHSYFCTWEEDLEEETIIPSYMTDIFHRPQLVLAKGRVKQEEKEWPMTDHSFFDLSN